VERNDYIHSIRGVQVSISCNEPIEGLYLIFGVLTRYFIMVNVGKGKFSHLDMMKRNSRGFDPSP